LRFRLDGYAYTHIAMLNNIQYWLYNNKLSYMTLSKMGED